jgi:hypothetical protein
MFFPPNNTTICTHKRKMAYVGELCLHLPIAFQKVDLMITVCELNNNNHFQTARESDVIRIICYEMSTDEDASNASNL